jgi:hypothetical protein
MVSEAVCLKLVPTSGQDSSSTLVQSTCHSRNAEPTRLIPLSLGHLLRVDSVWGPDHSPPPPPKPFTDTKSILHNHTITAATRAFCEIAIACHHRTRFSSTHNGPNRRGTRSRLEAQWPPPTIVRQYLPSWVQRGRDWTMTRRGPRKQYILTSASVAELSPARSAQSCRTYSGLRTALPIWTSG